MKEISVDHPESQVKHLHRPSHLLEILPADLHKSPTIAYFSLLIRIIIIISMITSLLGSLLVNLNKLVGQELLMIKQNLAQLVYFYSTVLKVFHKRTLYIRGLMWFYYRKLVTLMTSSHGTRNLHYGRSNFVSDLPSHPCCHARPMSIPLHTNLLW